MAVLPPALLTSCASAPEYIAAEPDAAACLKEDIAGFARYYVAGEAHVSILQVDGTDYRRREVRFAEGKHTIKVSAFNIVRRREATFEFSFIATRRYQVRANWRDGKMIFKLFDVSNDPEVRLSKFETDDAAVAQSAECEYR